MFELHPKAKNDLSEEILAESHAEALPEGALDKHEADEVIESIERRGVEVQRQFDDVGGAEGVAQTLARMSGEEKTELQRKLDGIRTGIQKRERVLEYGSGGFQNTTEDMWDLTKMFLSGPFESDDFLLTGRLGASVTNALAFPLGLSLLPLTGTAAGLQNISRRVRLGFEKRKLKRLEAQTGRQ